MLKETVNRLLKRDSVERVAVPSRDVSMFEHIISRIDSLERVTNSQKNLVALMDRCLVQHNIRINRLHAQYGQCRPLPPVKPVESIVPDPPAQSELPAISASIDKGFMSVCMDAGEWAAVYDFINHCDTRYRTTQCHQVWPPALYALEQTLAKVLFEAVGLDPESEGKE